jgi:hypothetical protein
LRRSGERSDRQRELRTPLRHWVRRRSAGNFVMKKTHSCVLFRLARPRSVP